MKVVELIRATYLIMQWAGYKDAVADIVTFLLLIKLQCALKQALLRKFGSQTCKVP
jgi:hypothetical protein